jgi:hypothetical protein
VRTAVVALVGAGCIAAAGLGGYLAVKAGTTSSSAAPATLEKAPVELAAVEAGQPAPAPTARPAVKPPSSARETVVSPRRDRPAPRERPAVQAETSPAVPAEPAPQAPPVAEEMRAAVPAPPIEETPPPAAEPAAIEIEEVTVAADAVIGIRLDTQVSSETARIEDRVTARVTRAVAIDGRTVVPSGSTLEGTVTAVQRGGKFKERARLGIRFNSVILADDIRVPIQTETIFRAGDAPGGEATAKIGASAVVGAILGAVVGGKKGAAIGSTAGAAGGTAAVMAGGANEAVLAAGTALTVRLTAPATFRITHEP